MFPFTPTFLPNIFSCSPYGDCVGNNDIYFVEMPDASELARRLNSWGLPCMPTMSASTLEYPALSGWNVARIRDGSPLLPPEGYRQTDPSKVAALMSLPYWEQAAIYVPSIGMMSNAGVPCDYYRRNPEDQFPGLADWYVQNWFKAEIDYWMSL